MIPFEILLADIGDVIAIMFAILVPVIWILGQAFAHQQGKAAQQRKAERQRMRERGKAMAQPQGRAEPRDEVDDFLRRVADRRAGQPERAEEVEVLEPVPQRPEQRPAQSQRSVQPQRPATGAQRPVIPKVVDRPAAPTVKQTTKSTAQAPAAPAAPVKVPTLVDRAVGDQWRQRAEAHRHDVFDHVVGSLDAVDHGTVPPVPPDDPGQSRQRLPATSAAGFAALLADTGDLRRAIVLSEILQRPEHRW